MQVRILCIQKCGRVRHETWHTQIEFAEEKKRNGDGGKSTVTPQTRIDR